MLKNYINFIATAQTNSLFLSLKTLRVTTFEIPDGAWRLKVPGSFNIKWYDGMKRDRLEVVVTPILIAES